MSMRALILTQMTGGVSAAKQLNACWDYITAARHLTLSGLLREGATAKDARAAIESGEATVVVAAYRVAELELTGEVEAVGGKVEYVHSYESRRLTVRSMIVSLYRQAGWSAQTIARTVGTSTEEVLDHLRRAGIRKPRRHE